jgi:hypothetical protein
MPVLTQARRHRGSPGSGCSWRRASVASQEGVRQVAKTKDVRAAVEKELGFDPRVEAAHITVSNIS